MLEQLALYFILQVDSDRNAEGCNTHFSTTSSILPFLLDSGLEIVSSLKIHAATPFRLTFEHTLTYTQREALLVSENWPDLPHH